MNGNNLKKIKKAFLSKRSGTLLLVINDSKEFKLLKQYLNYFGYKIYKCINENKLIKGINKINKKKKHFYDLIIADINLLQNSTLETIKNFQKNKDITFIFLSSNFFPKEKIEYIISTGIRHLFCNINDFDGLLYNINKIIPIEDHGIEIIKPPFPLKISFQNYTGIKKAASVIINDKASVLNSYSKIIKECHMIIIDLHLHEKLSDYFKLEIQIKLQNGDFFKKNYFFNRNKSNLYKEIKSIFLDAAIKMRPYAKII